MIWLFIAKEPLGLATHIPPNSIRHRGHTRETLSSERARVALDLFFTVSLSFMDNAPKWEACENTVTPGPVCCRACFSVVSNAKEERALQECCSVCKPQRGTIRPGGVDELEGGEECYTSTHTPEPSSGMPDSGYLTSASAYLGRKNSSCSMCLVSHRSTVE